MAVRRAKFAPPTLRQAVNQSTTRTLEIAEPFRGLRTERSPHALGASESPDLRNFRLSEGRLRNWPSFGSNRSFPGAGFPRFIVASGEAVGSIARQPMIFFSMENEELELSSAATQIYFIEDRPHSMGTNQWFAMDIDSDATIADDGQVTTAVGSLSDLPDPGATGIGKAVFLASFAGPSQTRPVNYFRVRSSPAQQENESVTTLPNFLSIASSARHVTQFDDRLVFGYTTDSGRNRPNRILWTARGTNTDFTSVSAGFEDLEAMGTYITALKEHQGQLFIFSRSEVWEAVPRRDDFAFEFNPIWTSYGCRGPDLIQDTPHGLFFYDTNQLFRIVGNSVRRVSIQLSKEVSERFEAPSTTMTTLIDVKHVTYHSRNNTLLLFHPIKDVDDKFDIYALHLDTLRPSRQNGEIDEADMTLARTEAVTRQSGGDLGTKQVGVIKSISDADLRYIQTPMFLFYDIATQERPGVYWFENKNTREELYYTTPVLRHSEDPSRLGSVYEIEADYELSNSDLTFEIAYSRDLGDSFTTLRSVSMKSTAEHLEVPLTHEATRHPMLRLAFIPPSDTSYNLSVDRFRIHMRSWTGRRR